MDNSAVQSIGQLAVEAARANVLDTDTPAVILTDADGTQHIKSTEYLQPGRSRLRGTYETTSIDSFAGYVTTHLPATSTTAAAGFIDNDQLRARVFFNAGTAEHPGHADDIAVLKLKPTAAYAALTASAGNVFNQRALHDFVEDWRDHITPMTAGAPDATRTVASVLAAIRSITIESARSDKHAESDFGANRSTLESVEAKSEHTLPSGLLFRCVPYTGLPERDFALRLGVRTSDDKLVLTLRLQQADAVAEAIAEDFRQVLEIKAAPCPFVLGTYAP